jgi:hypothetical protein
MERKLNFRFGGPGTEKEHFVKNMGPYNTRCDELQLWHGTSISQKCPDKKLNHFDSTLTE